MSSTTSRRLKRVYDLLEAAGEAGNGLIRTADLEAALKGKPYPMPQGPNPDFPFKTGDTLPLDTTTEWLVVAPTGTKITDGDGDSFEKMAHGSWRGIEPCDDTLTSNAFWINGYAPVTVDYNPTDPRTIPA